MTSHHDRVRAIVRLAAKQVKNPSTKAWLTNDEFGTWENTAREYLAKTADKATQLGLTTDQVDQEIAHRLSFEALTASLASAKKRKR